MTPQPKPEKRAPRPPKRIARGKRPTRVRKTSRAKLGRLADKLFSLIVRHPGRCWYHQNSACSGPLQCAHIVSRSYRSTRWDERNAIPLCAGAHVWFTHHPVEWEFYISPLLGEDGLRVLKAKALIRWDGDLRGVLVRLATRAVELGITPEGK